MPKNHLSFSRPSAAPPPSLFGEAPPEPKKKKKEKKKKPLPQQHEATVVKRMKVSDDTLTHAPTNPTPQPSSAGQSAPGGCGTEAGHLLLLLDLPAAADERSLQLHFAACAPLQVQLLSAWGSRQPRGAACLALSSARAVAHALRPELATLACGRRIRVCTAAAAAETSREAASAAHSALVLELEAQAAAALPQPHSCARELQHVLRCCEHGVAREAVESFLAVARSGTPKHPARLLLSTLLKRRQAGAGLVWLGRANGLPLPAAPAAALHQLLASCDWASMPAEGKLRGSMADFSFKLGLSTKAGPLSGPYSKFAFKPDTGVWDAASVTRKHRALWDAASALVAAIDPTFHWTSIAFNKNFRGSRHRDEKDAGCQLVLALGDFAGGELRVHGQGGAMDVNTRGRYVRADGRFEHEVLPFEGTRYSVVYFSLAPPWAVDPASTEEGVGA